MQVETLKDQTKDKYNKLLEDFRQGDRTVFKTMEELNKNFNLAWKIACDLTKQNYG